MEPAAAPTQQQEVSSSNLLTSRLGSLKRVRWSTASSDPYSGHDFGGRTDWVDEEPEENEDAWQLTGR